MNLPLLLAAHWHVAQPLLVYALAGLVIALGLYGWDAMEERR